jgi:hypothetical protein
MRGVSLALGAGVEFLGNKAEEFTEVGAGPAFDGLRHSFWNHVNMFISKSRPAL